MQRLRTLREPDAAPRTVTACASETSPTPTRRSSASLWTASACSRPSRCRPSPTRPRCWRGSAPRSSRSSTRSTASRAGRRLPAMLDPAGRKVGATYLRNNLNKRSLAIDLKSPEGRELFWRSPGGSTSSPRTSSPARWTAWASATRRSPPRTPGVIYVSISGFGNAADTPYRDWPAYASVVEAMSGHLRVQVRAGRAAGHDPRRRARRHQLGVVRGDRDPRRAAPPRAHRHGPARGRRDARRDGGDDRRRHQLLVDGRAPRAGQGARGDLRRVPGVGRLRRRPDRRGSTSSRRSPSSSATPSGTTTRASRRARVGHRTSRRSSGPRSTRGHRSARSSRRPTSSPGSGSRPARATRPRT